MSFCDTDFDSCDFDSCSFVGDADCIEFIDDTIDGADDNDNSFNDGNASDDFCVS